MPGASALAGAAWLLSAASRWRRRSLIERWAKIAQVPTRSDRLAAARAREERTERLLAAEIALAKQRET